MRRWFTSSKSYELASDQTQSKQPKERSKSTESSSTKSNLLPSTTINDDKNSNSLPEHNGETTAVPVAIPLKETTVEVSKKSHRRQKSSGNWQMLLGDSAKPLDAETQSQECVSNSNSDESLSAAQPVRVPVSSKEARPLSFFQKISADESVRHVDTKPKRGEIFPWGASQTPSPSADGTMHVVAKDIEADQHDKPLSGSTHSPGEGTIMDTGNQRLKMEQYKTQLSDISQSFEDETFQSEEPANTSIDGEMQTLPITGELNAENYDYDEDKDSSQQLDTFVKDDIHIQPSDVGEVECLSTDIEITNRASAGSSMDESEASDDKAVMDDVNPAGDHDTSLSTLHHARSIHDLENQHVKRNSDPCSVKRKRRSLLKRKSFPQSLDDTTLTESGENMEMKCEILKISTIDAELTIPEKETFVLVDPSLEKLEGHVRRVSVRSFNDAVAVDVEELSDTESERYRLAEATGETLIDTMSEESAASSYSHAEILSEEHNDNQLPMAGDLHSSKSSLRSRLMFKSSTELSSLTPLGRSLDEVSAGGSDKGSLRSFRSSLSSKSYSVNDLTLLERPSGFGTLDMNRLVGSFQMLDSIISEHTAVTPDEEDSLPPLASPVSATIQLLADDDEDDSQSVKSLTIIRGSLDDLTDGKASQLNLVNPSTGITIGVGSPSQAAQSQLSPVSAVIYVGGEDDAKHDMDVVIEEEVETTLSHDDEDTIMPLPSDRSPSGSAEREGKDGTVANEIIPMTNNREPFQLPWGARRTHSGGPTSEDRPGAFVLKKLFTDFTWLAGRKIERVLAEPLERPLQKSLQRGEDAQLDQLLSTLNAVAEHCLPSLIKTLFAWYDRQIPHKSQRPRSKGPRDVLSERRDLAVDFLFCLVLIEILKQLVYHPGYDDLVDKIIQMSFSHFKIMNDVAATNPNAHNLTTLADLYAEVLGVLAKSRFMAVKKKFLLEIKELRLKEQNPAVASQIISLIMGLKFFRVKMHPIDEFEACVQFLHDLGSIFMDTKDRDIKHAMAGLFVEIMLPMAAIVQTEVNVPVLRNFVEKIYPIAYDLTNKKRNSLALFPMVTCLLCVSQNTFFKAHWPMFLTSCLTNIKSRDPKMSRVALESLYRLVWVYMIRVKCESNAATTQKLTSIVSALFPKGQKGVMPRDTPLNIFVKMLQFIAREKLDFAMREVIFDLLSVGKKSTVTILPERMSIGLRAFLVISDNLQQKDGEPPMPQTVGIMPSGSTLRVKKTFLNKMLTDESAKNIGIHIYYPQVRKAFSNILRLLDGQIGRNAMMSKPENKDKDLDDLITVDKKPKLDLLRTCVAAIPRLMPSNDLSVSELVEMLLRYTVHIDEELRVLAYKALENTLNNFWETRDVILSAFVSFIQHDIPDINPSLVDNALRMLHSLMCHWKGTALNPSPTASKSSTNSVIASKGKAESVFVQKQSIHQVEGLALVMLCSCRTSTRKMAANLLKESHNLMKEVFPEESCVITSIDQTIPRILESLLPYLPLPDRAQLVVAAGGTIDLQWLVDQTSKVWFSGYGEESLSRIAYQSSALVACDPWVEVLAGILSYDFVKANFPIAASNAWPIVYSRLSSLFPLIDPNNTANDQRSSGLLRGNKKLTNERDVYINLWHNFIVFACCVAPSGFSSVPSYDVSSSPDSSQSSDNRPPSALSMSSETGRDLFRLLVPLLKCEINELRDSCITAMGRCSPEALHELSDELGPTIKDVIDRKQENVRRRKKKDSLRLYVCKLFHLLASNKVFAHRYANVIDLKRQTLMSVYTEFIDGMRLLLEGEVERDSPVLQDIRLHFSHFITLLIGNCPAEYKEKLLNTELRYTLFNLLSSLSKSLGHMYTVNTSVNRPYRTEEFTELELVAVEAMCATLSCGKIFDPTGISQNDGYIYPWLDRLLSCCDPKVNRIGQETCQSLLRYNADTQYLLDWTIDRCYQGTVQVADGCFITLVKVFTNREYPCDSVAMLNLALLYCGCPRVHIREMASQLLLTLCKRFLMIEDILQSQTTEQQEASQTLEGIMITAHCKTQLYLSEQLSRLNPELTIQIFSEVCQRIDTSLPAIRHSMFSYLLPWLLNVELVNPQIPNGTFLPLVSSAFSEKASGNVQSQSLLQGMGQSQSLLQGMGWGSQQASEMVLNNLMYLTVRHGDEHAEALERLWRELCSSFPSNLRYIIQYLLILSGLSPNKLLPYTKRVFVYLARKQTRIVVDELMVELQSVETLPFTVERCSNAPYFRMISPVKNSRSAPSADAQTYDDDDLEEDVPAAAVVAHDTELTLTAEEGVIFAKKLSEINSKLQVDRSNSTESTQTVQSITQDDDDQSPAKPRNSPYPLPMPAFGGYYAPLHIYMPSDGPLLINNVQRCFLSLCVISDLFVDNQSIDWTIHMPTLLQVTLLGCDHAKALVYEHCKKSMLSLLLCVLDKSDPVLSHLLEALIALQSTIYCSVSKSPPLSSSTLSASTLSSSLTARSLNREASLSLQAIHSTLSMTSICTLTPEGADAHQFPVSEHSGRSVLVKNAIEHIIDLLRSRDSRPLWSYETVTPRQKELKSVTTLSEVTRHLVAIFKQCLPQSLVDLRWCQTSLQFAMNCPSRHYAGRSLQIFRLLGIPMNTHMLSEITARLMEVVCESGEEMQGFVTEILQTIEKSVATLDIGVIGTDGVKDLFISTPNLKSSDRAPSTGMLGIKKSTTGLINIASVRSHKRSTSVSISNVTKKAGDVNPPSPGKIRPLSEFHVSTRYEMEDGEGDHESVADEVRMNMEEKLSTLVQMFWLGASLLESDYEYEFLLAVNLLQQVLNYLKPDRIECKDKMEKTIQQLKWPKFPGLHSLLVKGLTSAQTCNDTWTLLSQLTLCIRAPVISHSATLGFPVNVMCLLPYMVQNYEEPTSTCLEAADHIAQMAREISTRLDNLATVMRLYSRGTFGKDAHQWTKCVVKYLCDIYDTEHLHIITLLLEVLEQGSTATQAAILLILHCVLHYVDISCLPSPTMSTDLISTVSKFVEGPHWNEAQKILKLAVKSSSSLIPVATSHTNGHLMQPIQGLSSLHSHTSFAEAEILVKKDLPGKTLDFSFDITSTPVIGERFLQSANEKSAQAKLTPADSKRSGAALSSPSVSSADSTGNWRRPHHSQGRVRERLFCLLGTMGQRVGVIKSPSVIFSQVSEPVDRQMSLCSSSEETASIIETGDRTLEDSSVSDQFGDQYFKDFDFLDNETEHIDDENEDKFNWGVKRQHSLNEVDITTEVTKIDIQRINNKQEHAPETESSAKSTDDEGPDESEQQSPSPVEELAELVSPHREYTTAAGAAKDSEHTDSLHSNCSDPENGYSSQIPLIPGVQTFLSVSGEEVEEHWMSHINRVISDTADSTTFSAMYSLFCRLFKETKRKLSVLGKEVCFYLGKTPSLRSISSQFLKTLEVLLTQAICPFTYIDPETASNIRMSYNHKFALLELHEAYVTYLDRRECAQECLENIKSSIKMQSLGTHVSDFCGDEQRIELCNGLYRLQFQLLVLHSDYMKLINSLLDLCEKEEVMNMSEEMTGIASALQKAIDIIESDSSSPAEMDISDFTRAMAEKKIVEMVASKTRYNECIRYIRALRQTWPGELFGVTSTDDIPACLSIYCRYVAGDRKSGLVVVTAASQCDVSILNRQLLELKLQLHTVLIQLSHSCKVEVIHRVEGGDRGALAADTRKPVSPSAEYSKLKVRPLSPKFRPIDSQPLHSPRSRESSGSAISPSAGSKGDLHSPSTSVSGDEASKSVSDTDTVMASSAL